MAIAAADWCDEGSYTRLLNGDRRCFAWEWLRRTPSYVEAWSRADPATPFGLLHLENPTHDALTARPIWSATADRAVLQAEGRVADEGDRLDLARLAPFATIFPGPADIQHILLSDGLRSLRLDLRTDAPLTAPMALDWSVSGVCNIGPRLAALAQFSALARHGRFSRSLHPAQRRARRWIAMLRVHDALAVGIPHREVVAGMFGVETSRPRWRATVAPWRLRLQRLAAGARASLALGSAGWLHDGMS